MKDRGMMKWAPYKSLDAQADYLAAMAHEKDKKDKPLLSSEAASEINEILADYRGEKVSARYFEDGYVQERNGVIAEVNAIYKFIKIGGKILSFQNLLGLKILGAEK
jgi:hypothetical protein